MKDSAIEFSEFMVEKETQATVNRLSASLAEDGSDHCRRCDDIIEPERRAALPSAKHCFHCASELERNRRAKRARGLA